MKKFEKKAIFDPAEAISLADVDVSIRVFLRFIEDFKPHSA